MNKSIKAFALLLTTLFFLLGCGGTQSSSYILKNEMAQTTTTVEHKGDTVTKITILNEWDLKAMGPDFPKQSAQALAQATLSLYTNLPGVTSSMSSTDEKITFEITIDSFTDTIHIEIKVLYLFRLNVAYRTKYK